MEGTDQQRSIQQHEVTSSEHDKDKDLEHDASDSILHDPSYPTSMDKPTISPGEVMSLKDCCRDAFGKITEYLRGELAGKLEDMKCC